MKKLSNKQASALLRGAVAVSGIMCFGTLMLFCDSVYSLITTAMIGSGALSIIDETLTDNQNENKN